VISAEIRTLRLRAVTIARITPATAVKILGFTKREGQSPFALAFGQQFERRMLQNGAAQILALYRKAGLLDVRESKVVDLVELAPGSGLAAPRRRESDTQRLLLAKLAGDPAAPNLIIKPRLNVWLVGLPHPIEPDYLVAADADPFYLPAELKSYLQISEFPTGDFGSNRQAVSVETDRPFRSKAAPRCGWVLVPTLANRRCVTHPILLWSAKASTLVIIYSV
jgi:hypothetical protein